MTLIVAKIVGEDVQVISDTQITDISLERPASPLDGKLKTVILNPFTSISFSGITSYAEALFKFLYRNRVTDIRQIVEYTLSANLQSGNTSHFIICYLHQNEPKLITIRDSKVQDVKAAYIGDGFAYKKYSKFLESSKATTEFKKMEDAFQKVVDDGSRETSTVGQFITRVTTESAANVPLNFLGYQVNRVNIIGKQEFVEKFKGNFFIKNANASDGGYSYSLLRGFHPNNPAFAVHFHVGGFGLLFYPALDYGRKENCEPTIFLNEPDGEQFAYSIKERLNIEMQGLVISDNGLAHKLVITEKIS